MSSTPSWFYLHNRISAVFTARPNLDYPTISHYRNAASHRSTYYQTIVKAYRVFCNELSTIRKRKDPPTSLHHSTPTTTRQTRIANAMPLNPPPFASKKTGNTPVKKVLSQIKNGNVQEDASRRIQNCPGFPV